MAATYAPGTYARTAVPSLEARHLLSRFSAGPTSSLVSATAKGKHLDWFDRQLTPSKVKDSGGDAVTTWYPDLQRTPLDLWRRQVKGIRGGWEVMNDYGASLLARRMRSSRQVLEVMTEFWENHLHVPVNGDAQFVWRPGYGALIRQHALGRYDQLLVKAAVHPAMLIYLDGATSTVDAPNENQGRELLELHTVGVGNYTEADVKDSARILTGWRVDLYDTWQRLYVPEYHATGTVRVCGFKDANRSVDGRAVTTRYLQHLARHPDTARHLATKLATKFVGDTPPSALVDRLARTYLAHDTRIAPVLAQLVRSSAFRAAAGAKLRDPSEDVVATYRALDARILKPVGGRSATAVMLGQTGSLGLRTGSWPRPDGSPTTNQPWASPLRALASLDFHWSVAHRWWPNAQITYRDPAAWVPELPITFRDLVDHLSRAILFRRSTSTLLETCCLALQVQPDTVVTETSAVVQWRMGQLLGTILDSPEHYAR